MCNENCWFQHFKRLITKKKQSRTKCEMLNLLGEVRSRPQTYTKEVLEEFLKGHISAELNLLMKSEDTSEPTYRDIWERNRNPDQPVLPDEVDYLAKYTRHVPCYSTGSGILYGGYGQKTPPYCPGKLQKLLWLVLHHLSSEQVKDFLLCPSHNYDWIHGQEQT